ncbi:6-bladed beta-propeller [Mucilaginibacter antarcticus]|uniref:6-bladed beta-propeller n=1 Tax=Mucilaginibacter antarcticus TaxID=1855725 RepID=UPI00362F622D
MVKRLKPERAKSMIPQKDEFHFVNDTFYDSKAKLIEVLDLTAEKIFRFDTKGNMHDVLVIDRSRPFGHQYVAVNNDYISLLLNYNTDKRGLSIYEREGNVLKYNSQKLNTIPYIKHITVLTHHQLEVYRDAAYCFPSLQDKIYKVSSTDTVPVYLLDYPHNKKITDAVKNAYPTKDINTYFEAMENSNMVFNNNSLFINDDWVYFKFSYKYRNLQRNVFYSKKNKQIIQFSRLKSKNHMNLRYITIAGKDKDFFVTVNAVIKGPKTKEKIRRGMLTTN